MKVRKGSPTVTIRISPLRLAALESEIERLNRNPLAEEWTISSFLNCAIAEKIDLNTRRRTARKKKPVKLQAGKTP